MSDKKREHRTLNNPGMGWLLGRVFRLWRSAISQTVQPMGMTEARWSVMMNLKNMGEGASQHAMATELGIEMPSLNRTVNQLEKLNLIERRAHPSDGRCKCLWFTNEGNTCMQMLSGGVDLVRTELTNGISDKELDTVYSVLKRIEHNACTMLHKKNEGGK